MPFDTHLNMAVGTVKTAPSPATSGTEFELVDGDGDHFAADMPVTICPPNALPTHDLAEIGYLTDVDGDIFTISRAQEGTTAKAVQAGWMVYGSITAKTINEIEDAFDLKVDKVVGKGLSTNDYTTAEQTKLAGIATGATQNSTDAQLRDRTTHTGSQAISTVTGLQTALDGKLPVSGATTGDIFGDYVGGKSDANVPFDVNADFLGTLKKSGTDVSLVGHTHTKSEVGLSNVDNTSDTNKPVSTAQAAADALKVSKTGDTMTGKMSINSSAADNSIALTPTGDAGNSSSTGGAININNTSNDGAAIVVYTNSGASADGHLMNLRADNSAFANHAIYIDYKGSTHAVNVVNTGTGSNAAYNLSSSNPNASALQVRGHETSLGTGKITHVNPSTSSGVADANAAALSLDIIENPASPGTGTAAQGLYVDSTTGTTGNLARLRNQGVDKFVVGPTGAATAAAVSNSAGGVVTVDGAQTVTNKNMTSSTNTFPVLSRLTALQTGLGLLSEPYSLQTATSTTALTSQRVEFVAIGLLAGDVVTGIVLAWANTPAVPNFYVGLYSSAGTRLALSNDLAATLNAAGPATAQFAFTGTYTVLTTGLYYAAIVTNGGTQPTVIRAGSGNGVGLAIGANPRRSASQTGQATLPSTATFGAESTGFWVGVY